MPVRVKEKRKKTLIACTALLAVLVIIISCVAVLSNDRDIEYYDFQKSVAQGIDISEHNGEIDWQTVASRVDFAFIRVGYRGYGTGEINEDIRARENIKNAQKAGIPYGVYFYSQAVSTEEAEEEAKFVLRLIRRYDPQLPVVIDFEYPTDEEGKLTGRLYEAGLSAEDNTDIINAFCDTVEGHGFASGVYASSSVLHYNIDTDELGKNTAVWAADYNDSVGFGVEYRIWQYSRTGSIDGVESKNVDLNYYYAKIQGD